MDLHTLTAAMTDRLRSNAPPYTDIKALKYISNVLKWRSITAQVMPEATKGLYLKNDEIRKRERALNNKDAF